MEVNTSVKKELKWIKDRYGEKMMQLCRTHLYQLMEVEGIVKTILSEHFYPNRNLAEDIIKQDKIEDFKNYMYSFVDVEKEKIAVTTNKTAVELLAEAGYTLYPECKTEEDIQYFKKYYATNEELCTFRGGRLNSCRVWFAVKNNVEEIKRENFTSPSRQDEYGTSVISIQFSKQSNSRLSIKNRYNHNVNNPDNTFNSDLDNIIDGLSDAFEMSFGVKDYRLKNNNFELNGYVFAEGKFYKYNCEENNIYYCPNNIIIDNYQVIQLPTHKMLIEHFIVDTKEKTVELYDQRFSDCYIKEFKNLKDLTINGNEIVLEKPNGKVVLKINKNREIISLTDDTLTKCGDYFLSNSQKIEELNLPNLTSCEYGFLSRNKNLTELNLPNLTSCGDEFLSRNEMLKKVNLPKLKTCGDSFLSWADITELNLPNLTSCGDYFLGANEQLTTLSLPKLISCGNEFFECNENLQELDLPNLKRCGDAFLSYAHNLTRINLPNLNTCGNCFLEHNDLLTELSLPNLKKCGDEFLINNTSITKLEIPKLSNFGENFMSSNENISKPKKWFNRDAEF